MSYKGLGASAGLYWIVVVTDYQMLERDNGAIFFEISSCRAKESGFLWTFLNKKKLYLTQFHRN